MYIRVVIVHFLKFMICFQCFGDGHAQIIWYGLCNHITQVVRKIKCTAHIPYTHLSRHSSKCNYLNNLFLTILFYDIVYNLLSSVYTEVHVYIGHGYSFRIKESLKKKIQLNRFDIGNLKTIRNYTSRCGTSSRSNRYVMVLGIFYEVPHNQEIIYITHIFYGI